MRSVAGPRYEMIAELIPAGSSVLDVGCRDRRLEPLVTGPYTGMDLGPPADVIGSAEERLPFDASTFGTVVLADVLEHLDNPHGALDEAMRVADRAVVVVLPNMYTLTSRGRFLMGAPMHKYELHGEPVVDRHRWLPSYTQARMFTRARARKSGWMVTVEAGVLFPFRRPWLRAIHRGLSFVTGPDLWAWAYIARLEPQRPITLATTRKETP